MTEKKLKIRTANSKDYDEIINIFNSWHPNIWDKVYAESYYRDFFSDTTGYPQDKVFVGILGRKVVGVTGYCQDCYKTAGIYWLNWFYVHKDYAGEGYGGQLLDYVIKKLKSKKARKLYVDTTSYRFYSDALALYRKTGFTNEAVLEDYYGKNEDQIIMGKNL